MSTPEPSVTSVPSATLSWSGSDGKKSAVKQPRITGFFAITESPDRFQPDKLRQRFSYLPLSEELGSESIVAAAIVASFEPANAHSSTHSVLSGPRSFDATEATITYTDPQGNAQEFAINPETTSLAKWFATQIEWEQHLYKWCEARKAWDKGQWQIQGDIERCLEALDAHLKNWPGRKPSDELVAQLERLNDLPGTLEGLRPVGEEPSPMELACAEILAERSPSALDAPPIQRMPNLLLADWAIHRLWQFPARLDVEDMGGIPSVMTLLKREGFINWKWTELEGRDEDSYYDL